MEWENLQIAVEIFGIIGGIATIFGLFLGPMFWLGSKIDAFRSDMQSQINGLRGDMQSQINSLRSEMHNEFRAIKTEMHQEMKDFHGRLERQDAEFRQRFLAIEERRGK